jgi:hypothetical protein
MDDKLNGKELNLEEYGPADQNLYPPVASVSKSGRVVTVEPVVCEMMYNVFVTERDGKTVVGRAILVEPMGADHVVLLDIVTHEPENRRKGIASEIMEAITQGFNKVKTSYAASSKAGRALCAKYGFIPVKPLFKKQGDTLLVYERGQTVE